MSTEKKDNKKKYIVIGAAAIAGIGAMYWWKKVVPTKMPELVWMSGPIPAMLYLLDEKGVIKYDFYDVGIKDDASILNLYGFLSKK